MPLKGFLERERKMRAANAALQCFAADTRIVDTWHGIAVEFDHGGEKIQRRWAVRHGSLYPTWYSKWCHGGTACTALANLIRWLQKKPVVPLSTWQMWAGRKFWLMRDRGDECVTLLETAEYPQTAECVLCGRELSRFDWWDHGKLSGPCCVHTEGCQQSIETACPHCNGTGKVQRC